MEYIVQYTDGNGNWVTIAPIKRGRSCRPYRFSTRDLAEDFLRKIYSRSFELGKARAIRTL